MNQTGGTADLLYETLHLLHQLGDDYEIIFCHMNEAASWSVSNGAKEWFEFTYFKDAAARITNGEASMNIRGSYFFLFDLSANINVALFSGSYSYITIKPGSSLPFKLFQRLKNICRLLLEGILLGITQTERLFNEIQQEYLMRNHFYKYRIVLLLQDVLLNAARSCVPDLSHQFLSTRGIQKVIVNDIANYLASHYAEKITLNLLSKRTRLSPRYLDKVFKAATGDTIIQYLTKIRIESTKKSLAASNKTITDIALESGFESSSYFCKVFKKYQHISPSQFRTTCRIRGLSEDATS